MARSCSREPYGWPRLDAVTYLSSALEAYRELDPESQKQLLDVVHRSDPTDLMRRLVKEDLYTFAGTKLFPER